MRNALKFYARGLLVLCIASAWSLTTAQAQVRDSRVISVKAGGINLVSGPAEFRRGGERAWLSLTTKDDLASGDAVKTGASGRVEMLLNPGTYFRAGGDTEFELTDASLDDLRLRLTRGSAVIEATGFGDFDVSLNVLTPHTRVRIARSGVYRLNVLPSGVTEVIVVKGRAYVGEGEGEKVKGDRVARVGAGTVEIAKFDKKSLDEFDQWSKERGKELARANDKLSLRQTNAMLASVNFDDFFSAANPGYGMWLWNARYSCYTFLPFYSSWRSPYGFGYSSWFYAPNYCNSCPTRTYRGAARGSGGGVPAGGGTPSGFGGDSGGGQTVARPVPPPVQYNPPSDFRRSPDLEVTSPAGRERTIQPRDQ